MPVKSIWIGNDHGGFELKLKIAGHLKSKGLSPFDAGCHSEDIVRYPYYAARVAAAVSLGKADRGILICSTGIGMSMMANKYDNVRASLCTSTVMGKMTRAHNNSNILCLGGRITGVFEAIDILEAWLETKYEGGRHGISLNLMRDAEKAMITGPAWNPGIPEKQ